MDSFSISQVAQLSGIKPHTIRMWEKRYGALEPNRSEGNTRYYDSSQLRRLLNIASLKKADYQVSELCSMPDSKLFELVKKEQEKTGGADADDFFVSQLIGAGINYDELHFEKIFSHCLLRYGLKETYTSVIFPLLERLGLMWISDSLPPAHERFISNLIRQKLLTAIDSLPPAESNSDKWILFLPEGEFHELGLLFAQYLILFSGKRAVYLGSNTPLSLLKQVVEDTAPDHLLLFFVHYDSPENSNDYIHQLSNAFPDLDIYLSGNRELIGQLEPEDNVHWIKSVEDLEIELGK